ncbi:probable acyl-activating enzyme 1, peroxisomal isoform X2 [Asparagus officinalis]|uniref:probable acyl-activating enzyme 1, peroxisomal isoform X2 n=1 Tax=Asparagus officinalis TaxID=4686 RepID=UPI00098E58E9|nr:probable acyl-activating enzyme 1, peroxisomal isoform X2 [Asparagus officinalis]
MLFHKPSLLFLNSLLRTNKLSPRIPAPLLSLGPFNSLSRSFSQDKEQFLVAVLAPNIPAAYELHFSVPMAGAILCPLNIRHDSAMISVLLKHSGAKLLFVDGQLLELAQGALKLLSGSNTKSPLLVTIPDPQSPTPSSSMDYETLISTADPTFDIKWPSDECEPISINYTSGTTSKPKGVIYTHRGAYLNAIATVLMQGITTMPVYLWTVPMFHCNGWCLAWGIAAQGGTNVCIRQVTARAIFENIALHKVTHMGAAPTVLNSIVNSKPDDRKSLPHKVAVMTGGSAPSPTVLFKMEELGFSVTHIYGLTETYGPATLCTWKPEWDSLSPEEKAKVKARQGLQHTVIEMDVKDPITMKSVPFDGKTIGEIMFRGNTVMSGYYNDEEATKEALAGGWFHSGDLGVRHSDGYVQLKDRSKDIIISGGENISTIEVETVISEHPAVLEVAVVGRPDKYWGETPCAFVSLKEGFSVNGEDIVKYCRDRLPHYMAPKTVVFEELPRTSTGKVQKFVLREKAKAMGSISQN